jgi:hypothetical protein
MRHFLAVTKPVHQVSAAHHHRFYQVQIPVGGFVLIYTGKFEGTENLMVNP